MINCYIARLSLNKLSTVIGWFLGKLVSFFFARVLMFPSTSSRETSGLSGKQNQLFPSGPYIKCILFITTEAGKFVPVRVWTAWSFRKKKKNTFRIPVSQLLSKCGFSSSFHLAQGFLLSFSWSKTNVSWNALPIRTFNFMISGGMVGDKVIDVSAGWILRISRRPFSLSWLLQQKAMIKVENDVVEGDVLLRGNFTVSSVRSGMVVICITFFVMRASKHGPAIRAGSKIECVELCNFRNLVPRAHVPFGQHQDTELWNNQFQDFRSSGFTADACHGLHGVQRWSRCGCVPQKHSIHIGKTRKAEIWLWKNRCIKC